MNYSLLGLFRQPPGIVTFPDVAVERLSVLDTQCDRGLCFILYLESLIEEDGSLALASVAGF